MTYNHPVWMQQDRDAALAALGRLASTREARAAKAKTQREKDYLDAVDVLYGEGEKNARDGAYADRMAALHRKYPDDVDGAAFYALSLLGTAHDGRDFAVYMKSAAVLEPLFQQHPGHPGLAHYLIHSYDDPIHAPLGLRAARAYSKIAPASSHAQHMCSHIFVAMGMWDDVVAANESAVGVTNRALQARGQSPVACGHYPSWLEYGYLQQGRLTEAKRVLAECFAAAKPVRTAGRSAPVDPDNSLVGGFAAMRSRYLLDTEDWNGEVAGWRVARGQPAADVTIDFVDGFAAARSGHDAAAQQALDAFKADRAAVEAELDKRQTHDVSYRGRLSILEQQLASVIAARSRPREAIELAREAASAEEKLPFEFGPPFIEKPSQELVGELLLASKDAAGARAAFETALARTPERTLSLTGLMRAAEAAGDRRKADEIRQRLDAIWHRADKPAKTVQ